MGTSQWISTLLLFGCVLSLPPSRIVETKYGKVQGFSKRINGRTQVEAFLGVPYAEPPIQRNRFSRPKPPKAWTGVLKTQNYSAVCFETASQTDKKNIWFLSNARESEDCLYANIWRSINGSKNMTVMVWIHGGGLFGGTSMDDYYDGSILAGEQKLIVVSFNYRTNMFGMLYYDTEEAPGNVLLKDQVAALEWVRDNIAFFGGDPKKVTIFGESAGAWSVGFLLLNPTAQSLFQRAILQSGSPNFQGIMETPEVALRKSLDIARVVGCPSSEGLNKQVVIDCMREKDATELISYYRALPYDLNFPFSLILNGKEVPLNPSTAPSEVPMTSRKPILLGTTANEFEQLCLIYFFPNKTIDDQTTITEMDWKNVINKTFGIFDQRITRIATSFYKTTEYDPNQVRKEISSFFSDAAFVCPLVDFADQYVSDTNKVFLYSFHHKLSKPRFPVPAWTGILHGDDIPYVFGAPVDKANGFNNTEIMFSRMIMAYWAQFAKTGDPNGDNSAKTRWPPYDRLKRQYLQLKWTPTVKERLRQHECNFWKNVFPLLSKLQAELEPASESPTDEVHKEP